MSLSCLAGLRRVAAGRRERVIELVEQFFSANAIDVIGGLNEPICLADSRDRRPAHDCIASTHS